MPIYGYSREGVRRIRAKLLIAASLAFVGASSEAWAAPVPSTVQPGTIERELQPQPQAPAQHSLQLPAPHGFEAPTNASTIHIKLSSIDVSGNTALSNATLAPAYQDLIGKDITVADLYEAANKITQIYVSEGYALSFAVVPAQSIDNGTAHIEIIEGYVADVVFQGDTSRLPPVMRSYAKQIKDSRPLKSADLERFLLLANDIPGFTAKSVFNRIENGARGSTRLIITLTQDSVGAVASLNNRGSKALGPWRADATVSLNNLLGLGDGLRLRVLRDLNRNELTYASGDASVPVDGNGTSLIASGSYSDANPGLSALTSTAFSDKGWTGRIGLDHNFIRSRVDNLSASLVFVGKSLDSDLGGMPNSKDRIFTLDGGATYSRRDPAGQTTLSGTLTQGLPIFNATTGSDPLRSRVSGSGVYTSFNAVADRVQSLGGNFEADFSATGQLASRGLLSSEQCGYGGSLYGRGFDDSELVGDECAIASAELRYNFIPEGVASYLQPYSFFDAGYVHDEGTLPAGEIRDDHAESVGAGFRAGFAEHFTAGAEFAQPLSHIVSQDGNHRGRVFVFLTGNF